MADLIRIKDLCNERDGRFVQVGVSLMLQGKERLAILGVNDAGKTTLLRAAVGLETIASGRITLFGEACRQEREFRPHRPRIGFLFQGSDEQLFCISWSRMWRLARSMPAAAGSRPNRRRTRRWSVLDFLVWPITGSIGCLVVRNGWPVWLGCWRCGPTRCFWMSRQMVSIATMAHFRMRRLMPLTGRCFWLHMMNRSSRG